MKSALILGVSGQDGAYLSRLLLDKGYTVYGTSRDAAQPFTRLALLGIRDRVTTHTLSTTDASAVRALVAALRPDEIYNLSGLSSVALSFREPALAWSSIVDAQLILLDAVRDLAPSARLYHSASSECFGDIAGGGAADEQTPLAPRSPYADAKAAAHRATIDYRHAHNVFACSGIVFNHESPLRGDAFVTTKIVTAAASIARGANEKLALGDLSASRDWGYAPEYVEAFWSMLQQDEPRDCVIATGESHTVEELAAAAFAHFGLDHRQHVVVEPSLMRSAELHYSRGNPSRARELLGWTARTTFAALVQRLAESAARAGQR